MKKNIISETIANVVSNSKVLQDFAKNPETWKNYAEKLIDRTSPTYHDDYDDGYLEKNGHCFLDTYLGDTYHDAYHGDSDCDEQCPHCDMNGCMSCLGLREEDFV